MAGDPIDTFTIIYELNQKVAEFRRMLACPFNSASSEIWDGKHFYGFQSNVLDRIHWRERSCGISICVEAEQWEHIREVFAEAFGRPEYARVWLRLQVERGGGR